MPKNNYSQYKDYDNYTMLAERELKTLKLKNEGMSTSEIASTLNIKQHTVYAYLMRAVQKIEGVFNYAEERRIRNSGAKKENYNFEKLKLSNLSGSTFDVRQKYFMKNIWLLLDE